MDATDWRQQSGVHEATATWDRDLTASQAGAVAVAAGARRLLLTHFWPGNDRPASHAAAAAQFTGEIRLADEGMEIDLSRPGGAVLLRP